MKTGSYVFNGTTFHYDVVGEGEPVVFLHAGICDRRMWTPQMDPLAQQFRLYRYDMRGFGQTTVADMEFSHLEDLEAFLNHCQLDAAHLVGCSKGGTLSLDFALAQPDRVKSLTMVCSNPSGYPFQGDAPPLWDALVAAFNEKDIEKTVSLEIEFWVDGWQYRPAGAAPSHIRELVREMNTMVLKNELKGMGTERPLSVKAVDQLHHLMTPLLLIYGAFDDDEIEQSGNLLMAQQPDAEKHVLQAAHLPNLEQPGQFNQILTAFLLAQKDQGLT